jgi:sugar transferase (PEP-CTERM/EpsH1 system associated)
VRILLLTHRLPYAPNRGDRIRSYHLLGFLSSRAEVELVSLVHDREEEAHAADLRQQGIEVTVARVSRARSLARALGAFATGQPLTHALLDAPGLKTQLEDIMRRRRPDVVLAYCSGMARLALEAPLDSCPFVLDMVDVDSEKWAALSRTASVPKRWIYAREARRLAAFEARACRRAVQTLAVNEREEAAVRKLAPDAATKVILNGVDVDAFRPTSESPERTGVIFVGVFNYEPNEAGARWLAREVWPLVRAARPDLQLRLVGAHPTAAVRRLSEDRSIEVTGSVPDVRPYLWRSAVAVAPIWTGRGLQNKVLEAIAAGLPCVVTPPVLEGLPRDVRSACSAAATPQAFADAILEYLSMPAEQRAALCRLPALADLGWRARLAPLLPVLERAAGSRTA